MPGLLEEDRAGLVAAGWSASPHAPSSLGLEVHLQVREILLHCSALFTALRRGSTLAAWMLESTCTGTVYSLFCVYVQPYGMLSADLQEENASGGEGRASAGATCNDRQLAGSMISHVRCQASTEGAPALEAG